MTFDEAQKVHLQQMFQSDGWKLLTSYEHSHRLDLQNQMLGDNTNEQMRELKGQLIEIERRLNYEHVLLNKEQDMLMSFNPYEEPQE